MGAISYIPHKTSLDGKKKILIVAELALALFLFLLPGSPGRPIPEDGPDPSDLANFHSNGWPVSWSSGPFNFALVGQVAGTSNNEPDDGSNESPITIIEDIANDSPAGPSVSPGESDDETNQVQGPRRHHNNARDANQNPPAGSGNEDETIQKPVGQNDNTSGATNQTDANATPLAEDQTISTNQDTPVLVQLLATDADGDSLIFSVTAGPSNGTLDSFSADAGNATYTPNPGFSGSDTFDFQVIDTGGKNDTAQVYINVIAADNAAGAEANGNYTTTEDQPIQVQPWNNTNGSGESSAVISNITQPLHGTVIQNPNNTLTYTPDPNYNGPDYFTVNSTDGSGSTTTQNVTIITIATNDLPSASNLTVTTAEDIPVILTLINGTSDVDGDVTSLVITALPAHGVINTSPDNRTVTYTPNQDFQGTDSFSYTIADASYNSSGIVDIIVTPVNDIPILIDGGALGAISTTEGSSVQIDILSYVFDSDGDILTISNITQPLGGMIVLNADGTVTYTPAPGFVGQDSFSFTVTDSNGDTVSGTLTITVLPTDANPPANDVEDPADDTQSNNDVVIPVNNMPTTNDVVIVLDEDSSISIQLNATDPDGDAITFSTVSQPLHGTLVMIDSAAGIVQYLPFANYFGSDSFTYLVNDGMMESDIATVELFITGINDVPVANDDSVYGYEGNSTIIDVLTDDVDVDGDLLSVEIAEGPYHGMVTVNGDGTITYTPDPDFDGTDSFKYIISDGNGGSASATVTITLGSINDAPVITNEAVVMDEDQSAEIELHAADAYGGILDLEILVAPVHGSVEIISGGNFIVRYTPEADYHGTDGFAFRVTDGLAYSNIANVDIVVNSVNDAPIATSDSFAFTEDTPLTGDVLLNDSDVDGDTLSASLIPSGTTYGTVVVHPDGSFLYIPNENFHGVASFQYQISDGSGGIATGIVTITVTQVNDPPVALNDKAVTTRNHEVLIKVLSNDVDSDNDILSVGSVGTASHGSVKISADGKAVIYEPNHGFSGEDHFSYTVTDGENSASATVDVTVYKKQHDDEEDNNDHDAEDHENDDNNHGGVNDDHDDEEDDENDDRDGNDQNHDHDEKDNSKHNNHDDDNHDGVGKHDHDDDNQENEQNHDDEESDDDYDDNENNRDNNDHDDEDNDSDCGEDGQGQDDEKNDDDD